MLFQTVCVKIESLRLGILQDRDTYRRWRIRECSSNDSNLDIVGAVIDSIANDVAIVDAIASCDDFCGFVARVALGHREDESSRGENCENEKFHLDLKLVVIEEGCS